VDDAVSERSGRGSAAPGIVEDSGKAVVNILEEKNPPTFFWRSFDRVREAGYRGGKEPPCNALVASVSSRNREDKAS